MPAPDSLNVLNKGFQSNVFVYLFSFCCLLVSLFLLFGRSAIMLHSPRLPNPKSESKIILVNYTPIDQAVINHLKSL